MSSEKIPTWMYRPSVDAHRLRWIVQEGPIEESIHVIDDATNANSTLKPYKTKSGELHPIHTSSISLLPKKGLTVTLPALYNYILYDMCDPEDHSDYDEETGERAFDEPKCEIKAENGEFITIGEYIDAVYPWLVSLRERYIRDASDPTFPWDSSVQLWVTPATILGGIKLKEIEDRTDSNKDQVAGWASDQKSLKGMWETMAEVAWNIQHVWPHLEDEE